MSKISLPSMLPLGFIMKKFVILVVLLLLTSCASVIKTNSLKDVMDTHSSVYVTAFLYHGMHGLKAGEYKAEYADANGIFYRGFENCAIMNGLEFPGGVYVSTINGKKQYQVYWYIHNELKHPSPIGNLIVGREEGQIGLLPPTDEIDIASYVSNALMSSTLTTMTKTDCESKGGRPSIRRRPHVSETTLIKLDDGSYVVSIKEKPEYVACEFPASDRGKSCEDSSECEKEVCYAPKNIGHGEKTSGTCGIYYALGCSLEVEHGVSGKHDLCHD